MTQKTITLRVPVIEEETKTKTLTVVAYVQPSKTKTLTTVAYVEPSRPLVPQKPKRHVSRRRSENDD